MGGRVDPLIFYINNKNGLPVAFLLKIDMHGWAEKTMHGMSHIVGHIWETTFIPNQGPMSIVEVQ